MNRKSFAIASVFAMLLFVIVSMAIGIASRDELREFPHFFESSSTMLQVVYFFVSLIVFAMTPPAAILFLHDVLDWGNVKRNPLRWFARQYREGDHTGLIFIGTVIAGAPVVLFSLLGCASCLCLGLKAIL